MSKLMNGGYEIIKFYNVNQINKAYNDEDIIFPSQYEPSPTGHSSEYFTTTVVSGSNLYWSGSTTANTLSYSKNDGAWSEPSSAITVNVVAGDVVRWKGVEGQMNPIMSGSNYLGIGSFSQTSMSNVAYFDCQGNVMSLLYGDNFRGQTDLTDYPYAFAGLLSRTKAREIGDIALPATTLSEACYVNMFNNCYSATTAPELPAKTLVTRCYQNMFNNCESLNYIKMLATDISATNCLNSWVSFVAPSGTFVKDASMTTLPTGTSGIPSGWTVQDA